MKKLAAILLLFASLHARADLVIVQNVESGDNSHEVTIKIKGDRFRTDLSDKMSSITDLSTGDTITLFHDGKRFMKTTGAQMKVIIEKKMKDTLDGVALPASAVAPPITNTHKSDKVGDFTAEIFTAQTPVMKFTYWVAKDYPNYAVVNEQMKKFKERQSALSDKMGNKSQLLPDTTKLDGLVLKTEMTTSKGLVSRMTLVSARAEPVDDADLEIPAGYTEAQPSPAADAPAPPAPAATAPAKP